MVLEAGLNDFSLNWTTIQREVATFARVCSYDRAGLGRRAPSPRPYTGTAVVHELQALLTNAGVEPPYILVGHSFGGALVRLYARAYLNDVTGIVLVDAAHRSNSHTWRLRRSRSWSMIRTSELGGFAHDVHVEGLR